MSEGPDDASKKPEETRPSLTTLVRRKRADRAFFLHVRDAMQQNHKALERLGT